jgi:Tfp pilus assembly protein PilF
MSAKKKYTKRPQSQVKQAQGVKEVQPEPQLAAQDSSLNIILPAAIAIIAFIVYRYTLNNQFLDWDDWIYVQKDPFIKSFSLHNIKMMLFHNITRNYFHPITMLTLAMNYAFSKLDPWGYYFTNVLIHAANGVVIFFLTKSLLENMSKNYGYGNIYGIPWLSAFCALCHVVHPMHVESVAWMAERKDVLYAFFYFLGLIMYIRYIKQLGLKNMLPVVFLYGCSLLSKPMAVAFPLSLFVMDVLFKKDKNRKDIKKDILTSATFLLVCAVIIAIFIKSNLIVHGVLDAIIFAVLLGSWLYTHINRSKESGISIIFMEKVPFFLFSMAAGVVTFYTQKASGSIAFLHGFTLVHKLTVPFYSFFMYFAKAFVPFHLSSYYPYPPVTTDGYLPLFFYICPLIAAAVVLVPLYLSHRAGENYFRVVLFGFGFFFANVVFILQFLSSGVAIMAERYSYVAYFGIFFMLTYFIFVLINKLPDYRIPAIALCAIFIGGLAYICDGRTKSWHDSESFWHDVIRKYPRQWLVPYINLSQYYVDKGQMDSAFTNYVILVQLHSKSPEIYRNLANIYGMRKQFDQSLPLYAEAIKLDTSGTGDVYLDRAVTYSIMGRLDSALKDYDRAYLKDSNNEKVLINRAYAYLSTNLLDSSIRDYSHLIRLNTSDPSYYFRRGQAELNKGEQDKSINDFTKSLSMQANGECEYDLSLAYKNIRDYNNALTHAVKAKQVGFQVQDSYLNELQKLAGPTK